jgi:hypothetical protein
MIFARLWASCRHTQFLISQEALNMVSRMKQQRIEGHWPNEVNIDFWWNTGTNYNQTY